ncbi:unannotated protein [freshwater metagenome]|uniref:Unannotated protein n=1 Tax=freshwater metagenome TaxID=449393 RepID=A0A6J7L0I3_9ZZZZ|nr:DUF1876 domain-containing protein [Actinomycetota bacterium]MSW37789.1 DUF1876 domain-containing protein [Actinomycetota bacterium]
MKAVVGDRIVVVSSQVGGVVRDGRIVGLRHEDGTPPYMVQWSDTGQEGLYFPGSDGRIEHLGSEPESREVVRGHAKTWRVEVQVFEQGPDTTARAVLHAESDSSFEASGAARRAPGDADVPEIGDEVAVARALRHLADSLMGAASADLTALEQRDVILTK